MLNSQVDIYCFDTSDFYSNEEKRLHDMNHRLRAEKNVLLNGGTIYGHGRKRRNLLGLRRIESELEGCGIDKDMLKGICDESYDMSCLQYDIAEMCREYRKLNDIISHKNAKAKKYKERLLALLENKVESNISSDSRHHIRKIRDDAVSNSKIISVFESSFTRTIGAESNRLSTDFMIVKVFYFSVLKDLIFNGFEFNGERYVYFTSSAGQIRTKKCVFVKESVWKRYEKAIMCGLTLDDINASGGANPNKLLAYLALSNSATDVWDGFDIDKTIVVDDFETEVFGTYDFIDDVEYTITREHGHKSICHTDGAGMMLPDAFGSPQNNKMVRLPWVKGLLGVFPFDEFIEYHGCSPIIKDIYGKEHDIIEEGIQVVFTKSQFKLHQHYKDWDDYKSKFKQYGCSACYTNEEEERIKNATINYQMLQTLTDISDDEIADIANKSVSRLENMCSSISNVKDVFGVTPYNQNKTSFQKCIELYPEILNDDYAKSHLRRIKDSMVKRYRAGKLEVNGKYTFILPDFYAACEYWFLEIPEPGGLLKDDEVFCWLFRKSEELDCLRSPHLMLEHFISPNVAYSGYGDRKDRLREWFCTDALYTSCHSFISRVLQFDVDGDRSLVVSDKTIIDVAKRNIEKFDIVPLYYDMKKAHAVHLDNEAIYNGLNAAFTGGNIGIYSNNISKIWNSDIFVSGSIDEQKEAIGLIKLLCAENNYTIDYAKTLYKPTRPDEVNGKINSFTNQSLPHFFKYAKDKKDNQVVPVNSSFVNKLESIIPNPRINFRKLGIESIDYRLMMSNPDIEFDLSLADNGRIIEEETEPLIVEYHMFDKKYYMAVDNMVCSGRNDKSDSYLRAQLKFRRIADEIKDKLSSFGYTDVEIADILVKYLYGIRKSANKTGLWLCYGDIIYDNLSHNLKKGFKDVQCVDCGEWFEVPVKDTKTCRCHECAVEHKRELARIRKQRQRERDMSRDQ